MELEPAAALGAYEDVSPSLALSDAEQAERKEEQRQEDQMASAEREDEDADRETDAKGAHGITTRAKGDRVRGR